MGDNFKDIIAEFAKKLDSFEREAIELFSRHETSRDRVVTLSETKNKLISLSLSQAQLFDQSIRCIENKIYKAAHVMSWVAFMDFIEQKIASDGFIKLHKIRPKWSRYTDIVELRENVVDFQIIDAAYELRLLNKDEAKVLKGFLAKRNECAHPSDYRPGLNETLGYVGELLRRIELIQHR